MTNIDVQQEEEAEPRRLESLRHHLVVRITGLPPVRIETTDCPWCSSLRHEALCGSCGALADRVSASLRRTAEKRRQRSARSRA